MGKAKDERPEDAMYARVASRFQVLSFRFRV